MSDAPLVDTHVAEAQCESNAPTPTSGNAPHPVLRMLGLGKRYGQHVALENINLDLLPGEVHVLFGENGAGKSTLISLLAGARTPSAGSFEVGLHRGHFESVVQARAHGVRAVFQEFSLVPMLSVAENISLGEEPSDRFGFLSRSTARDEARRLIERLGFSLDVDARVASLPRGKQQMVEICKALRAMPRVLILDEPTASLSEHDAQALFELVRRLKDDGTAVVYITHRMHEIPAIGDRVSVLRDGRLVATVPADTPEQRLIELMTGRVLAKSWPKPTRDLGNARLTLEQITLVPIPGVVTVRDASLTVRAGEIVGLAGLVGCGKSELAQACFGLRPIAAGRILLDGETSAIRHPADAIRRGVWYSPSDRKHDGLAMGLSAAENVALSGLRHGPLGGGLRGWWRKPRRESTALREIARRVEFESTRLAEPVSNFSGGNQQKVLLAKGLAQDVGVYLFDEPTVGVDVGARQSIYHCLAEMSSAGAAILMVSSDLNELLGMTHRMLVMSEGRIVAEFDRDAYDEHLILERFF